jgi:hypothetical protein
LTIDNAVYWDYATGPSNLPFTTTMSNDLIMIVGGTQCNGGTGGAGLTTYCTVPPLFVTSSSTYPQTFTNPCPAPGQPPCVQSQANFTATNAVTGQYTPTAFLNFTLRNYARSSCNWSTYIVWVYSWYATTAKAGTYVISFSGYPGLGSGPTFFSLFAINSGNISLTPSPAGTTYGCQPYLSSSGTLGPLTVPTMSLPYTLPTNSLVFSELLSYNTNCGLAGTPNPPLYTIINDKGGEGTALAVNPTAGSQLSWPSCLNPGWLITADPWTISGAKQSTGTGTTSSNSTTTTTGSSSSAPPSSPQRPPLIPPTIAGIKTGYFFLILGGILLAGSLFARRD